MQTFLALALTEKTPINSKNSRHVFPLLSQFIVFPLDDCHFIGNKICYTWLNEKIIVCGLFEFITVKFGDSRRNLKNHDQSGLSTSMIEYVIM